MCFFFNDTATTEIYTLSLHDALPIYRTEVQDQGAADGGKGRKVRPSEPQCPRPRSVRLHQGRVAGGRKSTRLNSSHANISYAVFCLTKNTTRQSATPDMRRTPFISTP